MGDTRRKCECFRKQKPFQETEAEITTTFTEGERLSRRAQDTNNVYSPALLKTVSQQTNDSQHIYEAMHEIGDYLDLGHISTKEIG